MIKNIMLEKVCLDLFEKEVNKLKCYDIVDKFEIDIDELEFVNNNNSQLIFSYYIDIIDDLDILNDERYDDNRDYELIIIIEEERVLFIFKDSDNNFYKNIYIKEEDIFNYL